MRALDSADPHPVSGYNTPSVPTQGEDQPALPLKQQVSGVLFLRPIDHPLHTEVVPFSLLSFLGWLLLKLMS